jgi:hypothetical protein
MLGTHHEDFSLPFSLADAPDGPHFVARQEELTALHQALHGDGSRRIAVLHGLGGIGKTQSAIEYAKRNHLKYSAIFWLNVTDSQSIQDSFHRAADRIRSAHPSADIPTRSALNSKEIVATVKAWLSQSWNTRWLLIFDNYDNPKFLNETDSTAVDVKDYFPESHQGSIIITTRVSALQMGSHVHVQKMANTEDGLKILANTSRRANLAEGT